MNESIKKLEKARFEEWLSHLSGTDLDELHAIRNNDGEIAERFSSELAFGTGGLRGILGIGTNRMNVPVVQRATLGFAAWLKKSGKPLRVAVSYDSRINSRLFARTAAETLAACGIDAWAYPRLEPTPALSWAVRKLDCGGGIMITASHNPAEYNGYKVYGADGCQITDRAAAVILEEISRVGYFDELPSVDSAKLHEIPETVLDEFVSQELSGMYTRPEGLRVVYTPLNGAGLECVKRVLTQAGVGSLAVVPEQGQPNGTFPTCPAPNPEKSEAMKLGLELCAKEHPDLLLATDPDCDRLGVAVPAGDAYRLLSGNELGVLLLDYICKMRMEHGTMPAHPVAVTTIVSTEMILPIAAHYGVELLKTLTGFKYIGEQIGLLEQAGEQQRFLFGFEESYGYLSTTHVRDKDAVNASLIVCGMATYYKAKGVGLLQVFEALEKKYGTYSEKLLSFDFKGHEGTEKMRAMMTCLRTKAPKRIADMRVTRIDDYLHPEATGLPSSDVLAFQLEEGSRVTIRPSGTEPKMKAYLSSHRDGGAESEAQLRRMEQAVAELVNLPDSHQEGYAERRKTLLQFIKFCIVGISNAVVSLTVYYLIVLLNSEAYLAANVIAWLVSVLNAFFWNNRLVFAGGERDWQSIGKRLLKTYTSYGASMLLSTALLHLEIELWGVSRFLAPIINICITTPINFYANKFWAFAKRKT